ncbi:MAG: alpha-glucoside-specific PTS transporter subunit IIBC [Selenomonas sp.]|uniref:alpha-glucoside-specific PTS transporter subunit IIBC n=1 Tax=Selenomonas sp. TaxID=2053611 RepID=UPI0025D2ED44|nr:alpha-glucoside-specific PTS transporter subunit IIBC [Selenomonas sp.]MCR5440037.1 alpha-glucoside-specific PTS transporter subunit IIBC [Selenomonas sp.]
MSLSKDRIMQGMQRFGGAMYTPVILFAFFGIMVAVSIVCKNEGLLGSLAAKGTLWYDFWFVVEQGAWTVFSQMPILFAIAVPIGFAKKEPARCAMESFVIYMIFNYFISGILTLNGAFFGVDYSQNAGAGTGLAMIANIKTLDMGMLGAIFIACVTAWLHNRFYDTDIPDWLGIFKGPAFVVAVGFAVMLPLSLLFCVVWPAIQHGIMNFQDFLKSSGIVGVWAYTFSERILLPAGLHHFIYLPFIFGPAVCDGGIQQYWLQHLNDFATSAQSLKEMFPEGGFALHGSAKVFGLPGAALAMYMCAKPEKKKKTAALLIPATITAVLCGITEPLEFTFLFVAPLLYLVHSLLAATLSATLYFFGLAGNFGGGLIDCFVQNWIPLFPYHSGTYIMQIGIGLCFTAIYFVVFRFMILKFDYATPGRTADDVEDKLFSKDEYKAKKEMEDMGLAGNALAIKAKVFLDCLGGPENIKEVTNCATRLRVTVADPDKVKPVSKFTKAGAFGLVKNGHAIQVIVGLSVPQVRGYFDALLKGEAISEQLEEKTIKTPTMANLAMKLNACISGDLIDMSEVNDDMFSQKMMGDGVAIEPTGDTVVAPADAEVTMVMEESLHAIGLRLDNGAELLIHIGIDTVKLNGRGFQLLTKQGTKVKAGEPLIKFDPQVIKEAGYQTTVIMAVTNSGDYPQMKKQPDQQVTVDETPILTF